MLFYDSISSYIVLTLLAVYLFGYYGYNHASERLEEKVEDEEEASAEGLTTTEVFMAWVLAALGKVEVEWNDFALLSVKTMVFSYILIITANILILFASYMTLLNYTLSKTTIDYILVLSTVFHSSVILSNLAAFYFGYKRRAVDKDWRENIDYFRKKL